MANQGGDGADRNIGELWVELSREDKKKICDALVDRNQPDVMQEFATLVRFTRGYLRKQPAKDKAAARKRRALSSDDGDEKVVKNEFKNEIEEDGRL